MAVRTRRARARKALAATTLAAVGLAATLVAPSAVGAHEPDEVGPRMIAVCYRIPLVEARLDYILSVIDGDETVPGSLLWLEDKAAVATENGRDHWATVLENRLTVRTQVREILVLRRDIIASYGDLCVEHGIDL
ncbi:MAG: hypothetical protein GY724_20805 [Actinomycetia bacterium]|nr:hypothetical protein [Actinomycetes bacterium]MCP4224467.1 hypothetical protein [Actinomycetes bacterium]MCP5032459.1 hypothetical protein [Actinomycetes bacterium]